MHSIDLSWKQRINSSKYTFSLLEISHCNLHEVSIDVADTERMRVQKQ